MLSDEVIERVTERLVKRIEQGNEYTLNVIGKSIKKIGTLSPSEAHKLVQTLKYGGDYDKIIKKLAELTKLNIKDIYRIFEEIARHDYQFAKQFYDYRNKKYISWKDNIELQQQVKALAKVTAQEYINLSRSKALGFGIVDKDGNVVFKGLKQAYNELLDEAILNVSQGKETFDSAMFRQLKQMGTGLRTIYSNGRTMRLDSAVRMHMSDAIRSLHNETQEIFGKEFDADGVEISVHSNPAPDHEEVQGRQFSINQYDADGKLIKKGEFEKFQNDEDAISYDGIEFPAVAEETGQDRRAISQYNCYHYTFSIVLGISKPEYTNKQLQEIIDRNNKGFELDGKHYTMYEGTQMLRKIELELRKTKDEQILARASDITEYIEDAQSRITILTHKYNEVLKASGLPSKLNRARVVGYHRVSTKKLK